MLYELRDASLSVGGEEILSHADFSIKEHEKIGLIGANGAGKTTFLKLMAGELKLDRDDKRTGSGMYQSRTLSVSFLRQSFFGYERETVADLFSLFSGEKKLEADKLFLELGFSKKDKEKMFSEFSGGEQTKIMLLAALVQKPDLLLLDEPTNHLDLDTVRWLEKKIKSSGSAVIAVSHDRYFLDETVQIIYELEGKKLTRYVGNYTSYRTQKQKNTETARCTMLRYEEKIAKEQALIEKFAHTPTKASFVRTRKKILEKLEKEKPQSIAMQKHLYFNEKENWTPIHQGPKCVYEANKLKLGYANGETLAEISMRIKRGQKIGVIGANGAGKTTFLKTVAGLLPPLAGSSRLSEHVLFGYFDQQSAMIQSEQSVLEHFTALFPAMTQKEVRRMLGRFLFYGNDVSKRVTDLSGGEKARLLLAELLNARPNFMVLDEPTNHMDIPAKEALETAFLSYGGTMLFVSHDRYFVSRIADALLVFEKEKVSYYPFGYAHYVTHVLDAKENGKSVLTDLKNKEMLAGLKAVPKPEKHRLRELSTEEAYRDWKFGLASEPLKKAEENVRLAWETYETALLKEQCDLEEAVEREGEKGFLFCRENQSEESKDCAPAKQMLEEAMREWTNACLAWYDTYLALEEF